LRQLWSVEEVALAIKTAVVVKEVDWQLSSQLWSIEEVAWVISQLWSVEEVEWAIEAAVISWEICMGNWGSCDHLRKLHGLLRQLWSVKEVAWAIMGAMMNYHSYNTLGKLRSSAAAELNCRYDHLFKHLIQGTFEEQLDEHFLDL
jgi:hypothetical protein